MSRTLVTLRRADVPDAAFLAELWTDAVRRADHHEQVVELEQVVKNATTSAEQRLLIAEYDGQPAGAVLLVIGTVTPLNLEPAVHVVAPQVVPQFRRHGIGRMLVESGVCFAEENGVTHLATGVTSASRDSNRFMARLSLAPNATFRLAPVAAVRARLTAQRPAMSTSPSGGRQLTRVLAARRSMRRSSSPSSTAS